MQLTEDEPLPAHVAEMVARRSDGSPLFVTEMVAAMRAGADHDTLPESVEALMALQIDELAGADRGALRQASVMGTRFTRAGLVAALELDEAGAEALLGRLDGFLTGRRGRPRVPSRPAARGGLPRAAVPPPPAPAPPRRRVARAGRGR